MSWLSLVSLSQQDLPTLASSGDGKSSESSPNLSSSALSDDSEGGNENIAKLLASTSPQADSDSSSGSTIIGEDGTNIAIVPGSSLDGPSFVKYFFNRDNSNHLKVNSFD